MLFDFFQKKQSFIKIIIIYSLLLNIVFNWHVLNFIDHFFEQSPSHSEYFEYYYLFSIFFFLYACSTLIFSIFGLRYLLKPIIIILFLGASLNLYFYKNFGTIITREILLTFWDSFAEFNIKEIYELLTFKMFFYILIFGFLPILPILFIQIEYHSLQRELFFRFLLSLKTILILIFLILFEYKNIVLTTRTLRDLNFNNLFIPHYAISTTFEIVKKTIKGKGKYIVLDPKPSLINPDQEILGIIVVGETARSQNHSLNGYNKKTNPLLEKENIYNYKNAYSCGTLTNYSVPCMFYLGDYKNFTIDKATQQSNVLEILNLANIDVIWVENNSSCKNVCNQPGILFVDTAHQWPDLTGREELNKHKIFKQKRSNKSIRLEGLFDEELFDYVNFIIEEKNKKSASEFFKKIKNQFNNKHKFEKNLLIVLHIMGSHGPAYHRRYPNEFEKFTPNCKSNQPQECSKEELTNSYDNTILYTDYVLKGLLDILKKQNKNSFLLYASDHGESLGENGIYLHGLPRAIAPKEQIHIPLFFWLSEEYKKNYSFNVLDSNKEISHEYFPHTILELMRINSKTLNKDKSLITIK